MRYCYNCGAIAESDAQQFCSACGSRIDPPNAMPQNAGVNFNAPPPMQQMPPPMFQQPMPQMQQQMPPPVVQPQYQQQQFVQQPMNNMNPTAPRVCHSCGNIVNDSNVGNLCPFCGVQLPLNSYNAYNTYNNYSIQPQSQQPSVVSKVLGTILATVGTISALIFFLVALSGIFDRDLDCLVGGLIFTAPSVALLLIGIRWITGKKRKDPNNPQNFR